MDERVARFAMRRMDDHRGRLVDDQEGFILVEDIERQVDGHDGRRLLPEQSQLIPCLDAQASIADRLPVDKDRAVPPDVFLELRRKPQCGRCKLTDFPAVMGIINRIRNLHQTSPLF